MSTTLTFTCPVANGLHARPAGKLAEVAKRFSASATLTNKRTGTSSNAKSILAIVSANVLMGDACQLDVDGPDEKAALDALRQLIDGPLAACDQSPAASCDRSAVAVSRALAETGASWLSGTVVSPGIGQGIAVGVARSALPEQIVASDVGAPAEELRRLHAAICAVRDQLKGQMVCCGEGPQSEILAAHLSIVDDIDLRHAAERHIRDGGSAEQAVVTAARPYINQLSTSDNEYVRERAIDVEDIAGQLLHALGGRSDEEDAICLSRPSVVIADRLTPGQLLGADRSLIRGIVLEQEGTTAHALLLARSMGIPTVTGVSGARSVVPRDAHVIVDAHGGVVICDPDVAVMRYYRQEQDKHARRHARLMNLAGRDAATPDGHRLEVGVNVGLASDLDPAVLKIADGVGLLRTELVFGDREAAPTEEEQYALYRRTVDNAGGKPVIIRTFDVGADKPLPYFAVSHEENPALGCRGVRNYNRHDGIIRDQVRALLRASASGPIRLMIPMVTSVEEVAQMRELVVAIQADLDEAGIAYDPLMQIGIMAEVPIVAYAIDDLLRVADFVSIGTNDLAQYFTAADRCNPHVSGLADVRQPAFLRLLKSITDAAKRHGRWVGMCGDMASDERNLPLLIGLGLDEISAIGGKIAEIKTAVSRHRFASCQSLLAAALACQTSTEVTELVSGYRPQVASAPLMSPDLVWVDVDCASKAAAIKCLVDELYVTGRVDEPDKVEDAIWAREQIHTTGLGHGFAIPHCKSAAVGTSSVVVARLRHPLDWASTDGMAVSCVILLAMSEDDQQDTHMKVFSTLARRLMHAGFRQEVLRTDSADALYTYIRTEVEAALGVRAST